MMIHSHLVQLLLLLRRQPVLQTYCKPNVQTFDLALNVQHLVELQKRLLLVHRRRFHRLVQQLRLVLKFPL
jgi:hypothetical protein